MRRFEVQLDHQEDAVGGKLQVTLPEGAKAFDFGPKALCTPNFTSVGAGGPGVSGQGVVEAGQVWPDPLTGNGLESPAGAFQFDADVPDGDYWVWISAGKTISEKTRGLPGTRALIRLLASIPMGVPGMVLGLGYILFFNHPGNPFNALYHTLAILVVAMIGFATHRESVLTPRLLTTFLPLCAAWALQAPWLGLYRRETALTGDHAAA